MAQLCLSLLSTFPSWFGFLNESRGSLTKIVCKKFNFWGKIEICPKFAVCFLLLYSIVPSILTFDFDLICWSFFTFWGPNGLFLGMLRLSAQGPIAQGLSAKGDRAPRRTERTRGPSAQGDRAPRRTERPGGLSAQEDRAPRETEFPGGLSAQGDRAPRWTECAWNLQNLPHI